MHKLNVWLMMSESACGRMFFCNYQHLDFRGRFCGKQRLSQYKHSPIVIKCDGGSASIGVLYCHLHWTACIQAWLLCYALQQHLLMSWPAQSSFASFATVLWCLKTFHVLLGTEKSAKWSRVRSKLCYVYFSCTTPILLLTLQGLLQRSSSCENPQAVNVLPASSISATDLDSAWDDIQGGWWMCNAIV